MSVYKTVKGDTFSSISRKFYGTESNSSIIYNANPGVPDVLQDGTEVFIPRDIYTPRDKTPEIESYSSDEVALMVDGVRFRYWNTATIKRSIDAIDHISFTAPINDEVKKVIRPFSFSTVEIFVGGELLFRGTLLHVTPTIEHSGKEFSVSCYSTPGVLEDCMVPVDALDKAQFFMQNLRDIAFTLCAPFCIDVFFETTPGDIFDDVACESTDKILPFLIGLAKQRNLIVRSDQEGSLVFFKSTTGGSPIGVLEQGSSPVVSVIPTFRPQEFYTSITGIEPTIPGLEGEPYTVRTSTKLNTLRPYTYKIRDTRYASIESSVTSKAARMFGNVATYTVTVDTWISPSNGFLWEPNTTIMLKAPDVFIDEYYEFVIKSVIFRQDEKSKTSILELVIPGAFNGNLPEELPWG